jgi:hypothetical protein
MSLKPSQTTPVHCQAATASGQPCKAKPRQDGFCFFHGDPLRAAELGRKGGRRKALKLEDLQEFAAPKTAAELQDLLAQSLVEVRCGQLDPRTANAISYLGAGFLRALEVADIESRLETIEREQKRMAEVFESES